MKNTITLPENNQNSNTESGDFFYARDRETTALKHLTDKMGLAGIGMLGADLHILKK